MHGGKGCIHIDKLIKKIKAIKFYDLDPPPLFNASGWPESFLDRKKVKHFSICFNGHPVF